MKLIPICLALLMTGICSLGAAEAPRPITATPLADLPSRSWSGYQFLQADKEGRIFLLSEESLEVYQLSGDHRLTPRGRLLEDDGASKRPPFFQAAMSQTGDSWVLFSPPNHLYIYQGGRENHLQAPWLVAAVALDGKAPLLAVMPGEMNTTAPTSLHLKAPPLLQAWDGSRWNTLTDGEFLGDRPPGVGYGEQMRGEFSVFLQRTSDRQIWLADEHVYRLRQFSPSGNLKGELRTGDGQVAWIERSEEEWEKSEAAAKKGGLAGWSRRSLSEVKAEPVIRAMTPGRDGSIYMLVRTKDGLSLDRFQPSLATLDRVLLKGVELGSGPVALAASAEGLYIAPTASRDGVWLIKSGDLDGASWQPVPGAVLDGQPLSLLREKSDVSPIRKQRARKSQE